MENKRELLALVAIVGVFGALAYFGFRSPEFPDVSLTQDAETRVKISQARGGKPRLVVALLIPGDPVSEKSVMLLKERFQANETKAAFAAVLFSNSAAGETFRQTHDLPYPVYSLNPSEEPVDYNALVKTVGGFRSRFYGGTVVVIDSNQKMVSKVEGLELEKLDDLIKKL